MTTPNDAHLLAALADAEILRHELAYSEERQETERRLSADLMRGVEESRRRVEAADERQRELHVLLLNRDEEIARLHGYVEQALQQHNAAPDVAASSLPPAPPPNHRARRGAITPEARVVAQLEAGIAAASRWWNQLAARRR